MKRRIYDIMKYYFCKTIEYFSLTFMKAYAQKKEIYTLQKTVP